MSDQVPTPIGLTPRYLFEEAKNDLRIIEIKEAIERYLNVFRDIPKDWIEEYNERILLSKQLKQ